MHGSASSRARRRSTGAEADELVGTIPIRLAILAEIKSTAGRAPQGDVVRPCSPRPGCADAGEREPLAVSAATIFALQLPAALYRVRWTTLVIAALFVAGVAIVAALGAGDPALVAASVTGRGCILRGKNNPRATTPRIPRRYFAGTVDEQRVDRRAERPVRGGHRVLARHGADPERGGGGTGRRRDVRIERGDVFVLFHLPHGLLHHLHLRCGSRGPALFWAWIAPGPRTRLEVLASAGRSLATVAIGLLLAQRCRGSLQRFVTAQPWPWVVKICIGARARRRSS